MTDDNILKSIDIKIQTIADKAKEHSEAIQKVESSKKTIKQELFNLFTEIQTYNIDITSTRRKIERAFVDRGVSLRYVKELMPIEFKDTSKTRKSLQYQRNSDDEQVHHTVLEESSIPNRIPLETKHHVIDATTEPEEPPIPKPSPFTTADQLLPEYQKSDNGVYINKDYQKENVEPQKQAIVWYTEKIAEWQKEKEQLQNEIAQLKSQTEVKAEPTEFIIKDTDYERIEESEAFNQFYESASKSGKQILKLLKNNLQAYRSDAENYKKKYDQLVEESNSNTEKPNYFTAYGYFKYKELGEWEEIPAIFEVDVRKRIVEAVRDNSKYGEELEELQQQREKARRSKGGW